MAEDRTFSAVLQDILRNLQEIVRSEVRLAKVEIRDEALQAGSSALWITAVRSVPCVPGCFSVDRRLRSVHGRVDVGRHTRGRRGAGEFGQRVARRGTATLQTDSADPRT